MRARVTAHVLDIEVTRDLAVDRDLVWEVANDPEAYPSWIATLRELEPLDANRYTALVGFLSYTRAFVVRRVPSSPEAVRWEGADEDIEIGMELSVTRLDHRRTEARFAAHAEGGDPLAGLAPTREVAHLLVRSAATHSLAQLERVAASRARLGRTAVAIAAATGARAC